MKITKRLILILFLIFGLAGVSDATLSVEVFPDVIDWVPGIDIATVSIFSDTDETYAGFLGITGPAVWETELVPTANAGSEAYTYDDFLPLWGFGFSPYPPLYPIVPGKHFTIDIRGVEPGGVATVTIYDIGLTPIDSTDVFVIPEPVTFVLLGFGSLFLFRRKY